MCRNYFPNFYNFYKFDCQIPFALLSGCIASIRIDVWVHCVHSHWCLGALHPFALLSGCIASICIAVWVHCIHSHCCLGALHPFSLLSGCIASIRIYVWVHYIHSYCCLGALHPFALLSGCIASICIAVWVHCVHLHCCLGALRPFALMSGCIAFMPYIGVHCTTCFQWLFPADRYMQSTLCFAHLNTPLSLGISASPRLAISVRDWVTLSSSAAKYAL